MSPDQLEARLEAMLAPLRDRPAQLDELARARVRIRLEAALEHADAAADAKAVRGWRRRGVAVGLGFAAAAAIVLIGLLAALRSGKTGAGAMATGAGIGSTAVADGAGDSGSAGTVATATAQGGDHSSGDHSSGGDTSNGLGNGAMASGVGSSATPGGASGTGPITIAAGESTQVAIGDAAVTVFGPGTVSSTPDGTEVNAAGLVIDRTRGDTPWSMRYHGVKIVAMRATFALDHGTVTRATVMRGEIALLCPSGTLTIRSGASGTCEPAEDATPAPDPQPRAPEGPGAPNLPRMKPVAPNPPPANRVAPSALPSASLGDPGPRPAAPVTEDAQRTDSLSPLRGEPIARGSLRAEPPARELIVETLRPLPARAATPGYAAAESALLRGDLDAARAALLAIIDEAPGSLDAAMALLDLARVAKTRGEPIRALGYLDRLDRHPRRAALATAAAHLRAMLAASAAIQRPLSP